jgi:hypothetical protein
MQKSKQNNKVLLAVILVFAIVAALVGAKALARSSWG